MQPRPASPQVTTIRGVCCYLQSNLPPSLDGLHGALSHHGGSAHVLVWHSELAKTHTKQCPMLPFR